MSRWTRPTRWTVIAVALTLAITIATAAYLALIYPTLPILLPVRYVDGAPLVHFIKSPAMVFLPATVQAGLVFVFGTLGLLLLWRPRPSAAVSRAVADQARMRLAAEGIAMLGLLWISVQAIGAARLMILWQSPKGSGFGTIYHVVVLMGVVLSIVLVRRTMHLVRDEQPTPALADAAMWRFSNLYVNAADPALFVPTRRGVGWTLNFGRPMAILLLAVTLVVGIGGPFYAAREILWGWY